MTGAGGMGVDGGIQWLVVGDPKATFSPVSDVFFFSYHPRNCPSISELSDSLPSSEWHGSLTTQHKGILQDL